MTRSVLHIPGMSRGSFWSAALIGTAFAIAYALTLQRHINGANHIQMMDVAEMQIIAASWGISHPAGYPLYTILVNLFVLFWKWLGAPAAVASAGFSLILGVATLLVVYRLMWELTGRTLPAVVAAMLLGASRTFWLFASVTQTYTMNALLVALLIWLGLRYGREGRNRDLILIGLATGAALAHHRTIVHVLPWLAGLVILPVLWRVRPWRALLISGALVILPLTLYLYIPLRTAQGAAYQYMPVRTLDDFIYFVSQREYSPHFRFVASIGEAVERMGHALELWLSDLSAVGLAAGIGGLIAGVGRAPERRLMLALALSALSMMIFPLWYVDPDSMFIPLVMILAIGAGVLVNQSIARRQQVGRATALLLMSATLVRTPGNFQFVRSLTYDPSGQNLIEAAAAIPQTCPSILSHWGWDLKAYQYGQIVTGQLKCARLLTPNDDWAGTLRNGQSLYIASHFFYQMSLEEFQQRAGIIHLNSAGFGMIEVSGNIQRETPPDLKGQPTPMGTEIVLRGYRLSHPADNIFDLTLFWQASRPPARDYSVFVHVSDKTEITGQADILVQADSRAPVYGWYPTGQWQAGEIVRDDYRLEIPHHIQRAPQIIAVGMYTLQDGRFENLGRLVIPIKEAH